MEHFLEALASGAPVPGGGGAAALTGALSAALASMVANLTTGKKKYAEYQPEIDAVLEKTAALRQTLYGFIARDAEAFEPLSRAYGIPKDDPARAETLEAALHAAAEVPLALLETLTQLPPVLERLTVIGSKLAVSDAGCAASLCRAAAECAALNVYVNTRLMKDDDFAAGLDSRTAAALEAAVPACEAVYKKVSDRLQGVKA